MICGKTELPKKVSKEIFEKCLSFKHDYFKETKKGYDTFDSAYNDGYDSTRGFVDCAMTDAFYEGLKIGMEINFKNIKN